MGGLVVILVLIVFLHPNEKISKIRNSICQKAYPQYFAQRHVPTKPCHVLKFWFNNDYRMVFRELWFTKEGSKERQIADDLVNSTFFSTLIQAEQGRLEIWKKSASDITALIIVLDQFSRHCYRDERDDCKIKRNSEIARQLSMDLLSKNWLEKLKYEERVFAMMPLRHSPDQGSLERLIDMTEKWEKEARMVKDERSLEILVRFKRATRRQLDNLQDSLRYDGELFEFRGFDPIHPSQALEHKVCKTINSFLEAHCSSGSVVVSLSGGVDSMVLGQCLCYIRDVNSKSSKTVKGKPSWDTKQFFLRNISAVHVNYGNRKESFEEARFLQKWCQQRNIHFHLKNVENLTRNQRGVDRSDYEIQTREIRFSAYSTALSGCSIVVRPEV